MAPAPVAGYWLLYGFEDPVVIHLEVGPDGRAYDVTGRGCDVDWANLFDPARYDDGFCGALEGQGAGLSLEFSFKFGNTYGQGEATYAASPYASKDGTRMAGRFETTFSDEPGEFVRRLGWLRLADIGVTSASDTEVKAPSADLGPLPDDSWTGPSGWAFSLQGDASVGLLVPGQTYYETASSARVYSFTGDLGAFWNPDFHWDEATRTLTAGPVPETVPGMPVKLELHVDAVSTAVLDVVVTLADGATGTLLPVPPGP